MLCPDLRHCCLALKQSDSSNQMQRLAELINRSPLCVVRRGRFRILVIIFSRPSLPIPDCPNTTSPFRESLFRKCKPAPTPAPSLISKRQSRSVDRVPDDLLQT